MPHRCRTAPASTSLPYVLRGARQVVPGVAADSIPASSSTSASTTRAAARFWPRRWCNGWSTRAAPARPSCGRSSTAADPCMSDSMKKALAAFGPIFAQIYGQGESPMTITGLRRVDHDRTRRCDPGFGRLPAVGHGGRGAARRRHAWRPLARSARSFAAETWSCADTGKIPTRPPPRSKKAGSTPATWVRSTRAAI